MGEAKRRKALGVAAKTNSVQQQIEQIPLAWSLACTIGVEQLFTITLCQGEPEVMQACFLQTTNQPTTVLKQIDKQGLLVAVRPSQLKQFALLRPDTVHTYLNNVMQVAGIRRMQCILVVTDYGDAIALENLTGLWHEVLRP